MDEMGCDLVEVTAHMGARPDHAAWQGKVYRWNRGSAGAGIPDEKETAQDLTKGEKRDNINNTNEDAAKNNEKVILREFKKIKGGHTIDDDIGRKENPVCNPHFTGGNALYRENCGNCSVAYEMRRRGYDVEANPSKTMYISKRENLFENADIRTIFAEEKNTIDTVNNGLLGLYENGARGSIYVQWNGKKLGHFFSWEITEGRVRYMDAQNGTTDASGYFAKINPHTIITARWDNAEPSVSIGNVCKNKEGE